jgi:ABC-type Zn uptake system ZnuABC Zn-binding protein ZnuA
MVKRTSLIMFALLILCPPSFAEKRVVASVLPVWVFAKNVAGDRAGVSLLVRSGTDPHEFTLKPSDVRKLEEADLVLINGAGLEKNFIRGVDPGKVFDTSGGIEVIMLGRTPNPHLWLDPVRAQMQVDNIANAFSSIDPEGREYYLKNAQAYKKRLIKLHEEIANGVLILGTKRLITYHESFNYFAKRYGLKAFSLTGPDAEAPLPGRMREVYDIVREEGVKAVFEETQFLPGRLQRLSHDLGVRVCTLDGMVSGEPSADLYEKVMKKNLETIIECLGEN